MPLYRASLRALGAVALLAVALACGGKKGGDSPSSTITIAGAVKYTRVPLATDANGVPTGLVDSSVATNVKTLPARGVMVRVYQRADVLNPDGTIQLNPDGTPKFPPSWLVVSGGSAFTDANGLYTVTVPKDKPLMVELLSTFDGGSGHSVNVIGDPAGINSTQPQAVRYRYAMRKAVDGTASTASTPTPSALPTGDSIVNFTVGLSDPWWLVNASYIFGNSVAPGAANPVLETTVPGRTTGTGSRVLAIGDTIASFRAIYNIATPGTTFDLHYAPGVSEPRGSFVEYDRSVYPLAYDDNLSGYHYFGSLQGGAAGRLREAEDLAQVHVARDGHRHDVGHHATGGEHAPAAILEAHQIPEPADHLFLDEGSITGDYDTNFIAQEFHGLAFPIRKSIEEHIDYGSQLMVMYFRFLNRCQETAVASPFRKDFLAVDVCQPLALSVIIAYFLSQNPQMTFGGLEEGLHSFVIMNWLMDQKYYLHQFISSFHLIGINKR